ncbi:MAG: SAVED domain-containing protein [Proteobacteria bacterium]|nr:SAVED domain-containing protein [Pseudomonadota bacterium]
MNQSGHSESSTTETGSAAATPTWPDLLAAPPAFQVNAFDDLVLCMHPDAERDWRDAIPHAPAAVLSAFVVQTPQGPWHRDAPDVVVWESVHREIEAKVQEVMSQRPKRIHLVAKTPYSLGALLGAQLAPQNHQLLVYQHDNLEGSRDQKVWRPWGPTWPAAPGLRSADFFEMPPGMDRCRPEETGNLAVVVDITGRSNLESCVLAVRERYGEDGGSVRPVQIRAKLTGQGAIRQPADADKASTELAELLQLLSESFPNARLHVFYYGPLAVLIRASCGLSLRRTPIILWEAVYPNSQAQWIPAILFPEGRLLIADPRR